MRAIAALAVIFLHFTEVAGKQGLGISPVKWGAWGVDLFFVISGFIMVFITRNHNETWAATRRFWLRRIIRIVPMYWGLTAVCLAVAFFLPNVTKLHLTVGHILASYLFVPWVGPHDWGPWPVLRAGWPVNYAMFFSLVFGLVLLLPKAARLPLLIAGFVGCVSLGSIMKALGIELNTALSFLTAPMMLEFVIGVALGYAYLNTKLLRPAYATVLALLGVVGLLYAEDVHYQSFERLLTWGVPAALLFVGLLSLERRKVYAFKCAPLLKLGDASYSLYLTHLLSLALFGKLVPALLPFLPVAAVVILEVGFVLGVGLIAYAVFEKPIDTYLKRKLNA